MSNKNQIAVVLALVALVALFSLVWSRASGRPDIGQDGELIASANYACNDNKSIEADYFKTGEPVPGGPGEPPVPNGSVRLELSDGRSMTLQQTISASGIRYANKEETFVFWSKGDGALVLENNEDQTYIGCVRVAEAPEGTNLSQIYANGSEGATLRYPEGFTLDESYEYQLSPGRTIAGAKFTIPQSLSEGTNLSSDTYISVESLSQAENCTASLFLDGNHPAQVVEDGGREYSVATSSNAGAGNRYEETVYALSGTNPCIAVRYLVHYGAIQNYPEGSVREFDRVALIALFDSIRRTLVVSQ